MNLTKQLRLLGVAMAAAAALAAAPVHADDAAAAAAHKQDMQALGAKSGSDAGSGSPRCLFETVHGV